MGSVNTNMENLGMFDIGFVKESYRNVSLFLWIEEALNF